MSAEELHGTNEKMREGAQGRRRRGGPDHWIHYESGKTVKETAKRGSSRA